MTKTTGQPATIQRLPKYLAYLKIRQKQGQANISSTQIADDLRLGAVLVRKDLALASDAGKPKTGFPVDILIDDLERYLGYHNAHDAFLVGAGRMGRALLGYRQFTEYGLNILAAFDTDPALLDIDIDEKPIFALHRLPGLARRMQVNIGILTVPDHAAQDVCDMLVDSGMRAIWNFTNIPLQVPAGILIQNENLAASFAVLSNQLRTAFTAKNE